MATKNEIAVKVLRKFRKVSGTDTAKAWLTTVVEDAYDELYEELLDRSIVSWSATEDIPTKAVYPVVMLLCGNLADEFGQDPARFIAERSSSLMHLARINTKPYEYSPTQTENL